MTEPDIVWVLDSSALIHAKTAVAVGRQWAVFRDLEVRVEAGQIAMPRQVIREVEEVAHPDVPGAWAPGMRGRLVHPIDASYESIQRVMEVAGALVDPGATDDAADPWVVALALDLVQNGARPCCVTDDHID